jgi:hypothetical protein
MFYRWRVPRLIAAILMCSGITLPSAHAQDPPWADIALCLDVSGSVNNTELQLEINGLKECLGEFPDNGNVAVSITAFANGSAVVLPLTTVTPTSLTNTIFPALDGLLPGRAGVNPNRTNIDAGLSDAISTLGAGDGPTQSIILVGDGASNEGDTTAACNAAANLGITISAIAVNAPQAGQQELQACANATGGVFGVANTFQQFAGICEQTFQFVLIIECLDPTVSTAPGECEASVPCEEIAIATDLFDNPDDITITCNPEGPYPVGETEVTITATKPGSVTTSVVCTVTVVDDEPPVIVCPEDAVVECDRNNNNVDRAAWLADFGASDNCPGVTTLGPQLVDFLPGDCPGTGIEEWYFAAVDESGNQAECTAFFAIADTTAPEISCNNPDTIVPPDAPITFCASATDSCSGDNVDVSIIDAKCFAINGAGKRIDKSESCEIAFDGNCITILDSGGVGTTIEWTVQAVDECGNVGLETCSVLVVNPGKGNKRR